MRFVVSAKGQVLFSEDSRATLVSNDFSTGAQSNRAMCSIDADDWYTDEVWQNPWSNNRAVMVFVKAVNPGPGRRPDGVLYLEFDWEALMADVLHASNHRRGAEGGEMRISIVDAEGLLVGSSWNGPFGSPIAVPPGDQQGIETRPDSVAAFASARPMGRFDGLGLRCVIEQPMPGNEEIQRAVGSRRAAAA